MALITPEGIPTRLDEGDQIHFNLHTGVVLFTRTSGRRGNALRLLGSDGSTEDKIDLPCPYANAQGRRAYYIQVAKAIAGACGLELQRVSDPSDHHIAFELVNRTQVH